MDVSCAIMSSFILMTLLATAHAVRTEPPLPAVLLQTSDHAAERNLTWDLFVDLIGDCIRDSIEDLIEDLRSQGAEEPAAKEKAKGANSNDGDGFGAGGSVSYGDCCTSR